MNEHGVTVSKGGQYSLVPFAESSCKPTIEEDNAYKKAVIEGSTGVYADKKTPPM
jgi:hypothetical protein